DNAVTQASVAEKIGLSEKYISDIETGRKPCSLDTLVSIANALDVEPYELLMPEGEIRNFDSQKTKIVMRQLKNSFNEMVDSLSMFLENA
ncbi:MAG: helix-turn-helix transcriptional regulator, partial [Treponema sp.]|nr:helix-turn-helix transcriptional regulator [Treponema sp.]